MRPQVLKYGDYFIKAQKPRYIKQETFFFQKKNH